MQTLKYLNDTECNFKTHLSYTSDSDFRLENIGMKINYCSSGTAHWKGMFTGCVYLNKSNYHRTNMSRMSNISGGETTADSHHSPTQALPVCETKWWPDLNPNFCAATSKPGHHGITHKQVNNVLQCITKQCLGQTFHIPMDFCILCIIFCLFVFVFTSTHLKLIITTNYLLSEVIKGFNLNVVRKYIQTFWFVLILLSKQKCCLFYCCTYQKNHVTAFTILTWKK